MLASMKLRVREKRVESETDGVLHSNPGRDSKSENERFSQSLALHRERMREVVHTVTLLFLNLFHPLNIVGRGVQITVLRLLRVELIASIVLSLKPLRHED
jgi:hypothetical protein